MSAPATVKSSQFLECQTEEHFDKMAKQKITREHTTPLSHSVLVKFGFFLKESGSGYHLGNQKVPLTAEQIECSDFLLSAVQDDTALPSLERSGNYKYLEPKNCKFTLLWHLIKCIFMGETSHLAAHLDHSIFDLPLKLDKPAT